MVALTHDAASTQTTGLWRVIAPLIVVAGNLAGCVSAPANGAHDTPSQAPPPKEMRILTVPTPLTPDQAAERSRRYQQLQDALTSDSKTANHVLLVDPSSYGSGRQFFTDVKTRMDGMIATWPDLPQRNITRDIVIDMLQIANRESQTLAPINSGLYIKAGEKYSPDLTMLNLSRRTYQEPFTEPSDRHFICIAVGQTANTDNIRIYENLNNFAPAPSTRYNDAFKAIFDATDPLRLRTDEHELGHCIGTLRQKPNETDMLKTRRGETKSDIFYSMLEISEQGAAAATAIEAMVQYRRGMQVMVFSAEENYSDHDTTQGLRLLQRDLQKNPAALQQKLKGMSINAIGEMAARYAERATAIEYPHLDDKTKNAKQLYSLTQAADADFAFSTRFVAGNMLVKDYQGMPETLSPRAALNILQLAYAAEHVLVQPPQSQLKQAVAALREQFPQQMQAAERQFQAELSQFPPLPGLVQEPGQAKQAALPPRKTRGAAALSRKALI